MNRPLVSICIPTYNGAKYLRECLESILAQTFADFEVIISDDGSTDETLDIVGSYASRDKRIAIHRNEINLGLVHNWNKSLSYARGQWIKFLFQDDLLAVSCLSEMTREIPRGIPLIFCKRNFIFDDTVTAKTKDFFENILTVDKLYPGKRQLDPADVLRAVSDNLYLNFIGEPTAALVKKDAFFYYGLFNPFLVQLCDYEYWVRVGIHTGLVYIPDELATFRVHGSGASLVNESQRHFRAAWLEMLILFHEYSSNPLFESLRAENAKKDFLELLAYYTRRVKRQVESKAGKSAGNTNAEEWRKILASFPLLSVVGNKYFHFPQRVRKRLRKVLKRGSS